MNRNFNSIFTVVAISCVGINDHRPAACGSNILRIYEQNIQISFDVVFIRFFSASLGPLSLLLLAQHLQLEPQKRSKWFFNCIRTYWFLCGFQLEINIVIELNIAKCRALCCRTHYMNYSFGNNWLIIKPNPIYTTNIKTFVMDWRTMETPMIAATLLHDICLLRSGES